MAKFVKVTLKAMKVGAYRGAMRLQIDTGFGDPLLIVSDEKILALEEFPTTNQTEECRSNVLDACFPLNRCPWFLMFVAMSMISAILAYLKFQAAQG